MKTIYKFEVPIQDDFTLLLPPEARVLSVQVQHGTSRVWVLGDFAQSKAIRRFHLSGTGHPVPDDVADDFDFVGTFQIIGGDLVFHLFAERAKRGIQ